MQALYKPKRYPDDVRREVLSRSQTAREIANRWMLGWPHRVKALFEANEYLIVLEMQTEQEEKAKADPYLTHLSSWEKAKEWGLPLSPPTASDRYVEEAAGMRDGWDDEGEDE